MSFIVFSVCILLIGSYSSQATPQEEQGPAIYYPAGPYAFNRGFPLLQTPMQTNLGRVFFSNINFSRKNLQLITTLNIIQ